ncbi:MAG: DUF86 domain-containing protein [Planctomycetes bacterium]|nr:DUF86 domain-containing protein [Planctomycetota bacterium]
MLDMARLAVRKVVGKTRAEFDADENLRLALTHLIQTMGEAARHVSPSFQHAHGRIPWAKIIGIRHKVVHDYMHVDYDIVWDVVTVNLPPVVVELEAIVLPETDEPEK